MIHAPVGGAVGVNNEFYEGGQFMPTFDLPKKHKRAVSVQARNTRNIAEIIAKPMDNGKGTVRYREAGSPYTNHVLYCDTYSEAEQAARYMLEESRNWYVEQGLQPHPTELILEGGN